MTYASFSPYENQIITGTMADVAQIWDSKTENLIRSIASIGGVGSATISPDHDLIFTGNFEGTGRLWDTTTGKVVHTFKIEGNSSSVAFSPDGSKAAIGSHLVK